MTTPRKIITIRNVKALPQLLQVCEEVEVKELAKEMPEVSDLKRLLNEKLPDVAECKHKTPAYLAANQIGYRKRILFVYLPEEKESVVMYNPTYTIKKAAAGKEDFRISTFLIEQVRFSNQCYAEELEVTYRDAYWKQQTRVLKGLAAIAAQMGIDFLYGITPLDRAGDKFIKTADAYKLQNRDSEIDLSKPQFQTDELEYIPVLKFLRIKNPVNVKKDPARVQVTDQQAQLVMVPSV